MLERNLTHTHTHMIDCRTHWTPVVSLNEQITCDERRWRPRMDGKSVSQSLHVSLMIRHPQTLLQVTWAELHSHEELDNWTTFIISSAVFSAVQLYQYHTTSPSNWCRITKLLSSQSNMLLNMLSLRLCVVLGSLIHLNESVCLLFNIVQMVNWFIIILRYDYSDLYLSKYIKEKMIIQNVLYFK